MNNCKNCKFKKMLVDANKELNALQKKCTDYILIFNSGAYKKSFDQEMTKCKSSSDALSWLSKPSTEASYMKSSTDKISKLIQEHEIAEGDVILLPYEDDRLKVDTLLPFNVCKIVDGNKALCHCRFALDSVLFNGTNNNNYKDSLIRKWMANLLSRFDGSMANHFLTADVTYLDLKDEQLKVVQDKFWLLDHIELFSFYKTMDERKRTYIADNADAVWWLRTPDIRSAYHFEYLVKPHGNSMHSDLSYHSYGCVPACLIG